MYNTPPPNLLHGINLVQAGQKHEALIYLRHAARHEPLTAEGWLWLAAATDNLDEYTYSVDQALRLDPRHPIAARMRGDLNRLAGWNRPAETGTGEPTNRPAPATEMHRLSRARRAMSRLLKRDRSSSHSTTGGE
jgi:Flp pilus assembly protein TadD